MSALAFVAERAAKAYVAGDRVEDGIGVLARARAHGAAGTLAYWNDRGEAPEQVARRYVEAIAAIAADRRLDDAGGSREADPDGFRAKGQRRKEGSGQDRIRTDQGSVFVPFAPLCAESERPHDLRRDHRDAYVSIKGPAIGGSRALAERVGDAARAAGVGLHLDSLGIETADAIFAIFDALNAGSLDGDPLVGMTLPGRWRRSIADAERVGPDAARVRVVKGQWADPDEPERDGRAGFLAVIDRLAGHARRVAVATHDPVLAREALRRLALAGTPAELELLHGLPRRDAAQVAREAGVPLRLYVPYGRAWLPYCLAQARANPRIPWWLVRDAFLRAPHERGF